MLLYASDATGEDIGCAGSRKWENSGLEFSELALFAFELGRV